MSIHREVMETVLRKKGLRLPMDAKARILDKMRETESPGEWASAIINEVKANKDFVDFARRKCSSTMCAIRDLIEFNLLCKGIEKSLDWVYAKTRNMMAVKIDSPEFYAQLQKEIST